MSEHGSLFTMGTQHLNAEMSPVTSVIAEVFDLFMRKMQKNHKIV